MINLYKRIQIQVEMDLNRNPNFWAFITDFIKPDLYFLSLFVTSYVISRKKTWSSCLKDCKRPTNENVFKLFPKTFLDWNQSPHHCGYFNVLLWCWFRYFILSAQGGSVWDAILFLAPRFWAPIWSNFKQKGLAGEGIELGSSGWEPGALTTTPSGNWYEFLFKS